MENVRVVIGTGYGDEGKGASTDYLSTDWADLCVRFNGGAQAGHTVYRKNAHHVFSHFGSATLQGIPTYLGPRFVTNPWIFRKEREELLSKGISPEVIVHPDCYVTTPFDVLINQIVESYRESKHGSVGVGFNETITRCYDRQLLTTVSDPASNLLEIKDNYFYPRLEELGVPGDYISSQIGHIDLNKVMAGYLRECDYFNRHILAIEDCKALDSFDNVIFEGAQGLKLDEFDGIFPYVTRSRTGLPNVLKMVGKSIPMSVFYITRSYATRHGAGPLDKEEPLPSWVVDTTNVPNKFQGSLRYAPLSFLDIQGWIDRDLNDARGWNITPYAMITCMDQYENNDLRSDMNDWGRFSYVLTSYGKNSPRCGFDVRTCHTRSSVRATSRVVWVPQL